VLSVSEAVAQRISTRAFLPKPVPEPLVRDLLAKAARAPSGGNLQPWKVYVVAGAARQRVSEAVLDRVAEDPMRDEGEFPVYPPGLWDPYRARRTKLAEDMYALLGIPRQDKPARLAHVARNYEFFGAPVGLFFALDRRMGPGQWAHLGMFMQTLALLAEEAGLATCMQEAWSRRAPTVAKILGLPPEEQLYCGMALGYADPDHPVNALRADREDVDAFARFEGFEAS